MSDEDTMFTPGQEGALKDWVNHEGDREVDFIRSGGNLDPDRLPKSYFMRYLFLVQEECSTAPIVDKNTYLRNFLNAGGEIPKPKNYRLQQVGRKINLVPLEGTGSSAPPNDESAAKEKGVSNETKRGSRATSQSSSGNGGLLIFLALLVFGVLAFLVFPVPHLVGYNPLYMGRETSEPTATPAAATAITGGLSTDRYYRDMFIADPGQSPRDYVDYPEGYSSDNAYDWQPHNNTYWTSVQSVVPSGSPAVNPTEAPAASPSAAPSWAPSNPPQGECTIPKVNTWNDNGSNPPWDMEVQSKDGPSHIDYYTRINGHNTPAVSFITGQLLDGVETMHWSGFGSMWTNVGSGCNPQMDAARYVIKDRCAPSNNNSGLAIDLTDPTHPVLVANRDNLTADQINSILAPIQDAINNNRSQHPDQPELNLHFMDGTALITNDQVGGNPCEGTTGTVCTIADPGVRPADVAPDPHRPWAPPDTGWVVLRAWTNKTDPNFPPHGQEIVVLYGPDVSSRPLAIIGGARWVFTSECAARQDFEGQTAYQGIHIDLTAGDHLPSQFLP